MGKNTVRLAMEPTRAAGLLAMLVMAAMSLWLAAPTSAQSRFPRYVPGAEADYSQLQFNEPLLPSLPEPEEESALNLESIPSTPQGGLQVPPSPTTAPSRVSPQGPMTPHGGLYAEMIGDHGLGCTDADPPAAVYNTGTWFWRGRWYTQVDFVTLYHGAPQPVALGADTNIVDFTLLGRPSYPNALKTTDNSFRFEPGMRLSVGRILGRDAANRDHYVEFSYLGLFDWSKSDQIVASNQGAISTSLAPGGLPVVNGVGVPQVFVDGFTFVDRQAYRYTSDLDNFEINFRFRGRPGQDVVTLQPDGAWVRHSEASSLRGFLFGLRVMTKNEDLLYTSAGDEVPDNPDQNGDQSIPGQIGAYQVSTSNDMLGPQLGFELLERYDDFYFGARGKAGLLLNFADRTSRLDSLVGPTSDSDSRTTSNFQKLEDEQLAAVLEVGIMGAYQIRPYLALRAAYDAMYVTGVAVAGENLALPNFPVLNVEGDTIYHGLSVGIERIW